MPIEFEFVESIKIDCNFEAEIPKLKDIFSKLSGETEEVSIINLSEFLSGTDEPAKSPPVKGSVERV